MPDSLCSEKRALLQIIFYWGGEREDAILSFPFKTYFLTKIFSNNEKRGRYLRWKITNISPKKVWEGVPAIEQYTQTGRKRTESVLHSLSSFLDKHCICRHKCSIKLEVICWPCQRDIVASNSDIAPSCFATLWSQWYYIRLSSSHSEYHSAIAEYHCEAIELAEGEYNCGTCSTAGATIGAFVYECSLKTE